MKFVLFPSNIYLETNTNWLKDLNNSCDSYINELKIKTSELTYHSENLINDKNFYNFIEYILKKSFIILNEQGYDLQNYSLITKDIWVQEFSEKGGGNHNTHTHQESHISGFYFLKASLETSFPIFHDPRPGKLMTQLPEKDDTILSDASAKSVIKISPGVLIFFNSYLPHEFPVDSGKEPFRFIHFNIQAVSKNLINGNIQNINDSKNHSSNSL